MSLHFSPFFICFEGTGKRSNTCTTDKGGGELACAFGYPVLVLFSSDKSKSFSFPFFLCFRGTEKSLLKEKSGKGKLFYCFFFRYFFALFPTKAKMEKYGEKEFPLLLFGFLFSLIKRKVKRGKIGNSTKRFCYLNLFIFSSSPNFLLRGDLLPVFITMKTGRG